LSAVKRAVEQGLAKRRLGTIRWIGIDEVSRKKGHHYLTLVDDLQRHRLLWIGEGRKEATLDEFFAWLGPRRSRNLVVVCMDMWAPYLKSVQTHAVRARIAFDRFHLMGHLNAAVDEVRRSLARKLKSPMRATIKGSRFVLLKNPWNLTPSQKQQLNALVRQNSPLSRAWYLKEDFRRFFDYVREAWASRHLEHWLRWANRSRLPPFRKFARLVKEHQAGILAWTTIRVSNGALEGMNNKVKLVIHRAYGFRNVKQLKIAIYHSCANLPI
jgi:transposase